MKIGLIARADRSGLAVQTWEFWRHMSPVKTIVINPTWVGQDHRIDHSMYPGSVIMDSKPYPEESFIESNIIEDFLDGLDIVFTCETPYNFWLFKRASELGVKTVLQYNYEFLYTLSNSRLPKPDLLAAPSLWNYEKVVGNKVFLPVPVNRSVLPFVQRKELGTILHCAGIPAAFDRNGTLTLIEAVRMLPRRIDIKVKIRSQYFFESFDDPRIEVIIDKPDRYYDLYQDEDVFVFPRKYGGLSLPLNEAASCGMAILSTNVSPQSSFLHERCLVDAFKTNSFMANAMVDVYECKASDLADKIVELYECPDLVAESSSLSNDYAASIDWSAMKDNYLSIFGDLLDCR